MQSGNKIRIVLVGGSGYAGLEVLRHLARHPHASVVGVFGPSDETGPVEEFFPVLSGVIDLAQKPFDPDAIKALDADLAMLCVPHKVAMSYVPTLLDAGLRVIDWSADYRFNDADMYEKWYCPHTDRDNLDRAVYGLPEFYREEISEATLVANPGCYPTCASLGIVPLLRQGLIKPEGIIVNAISGVSGAGRTPSAKQHFPERNENFEPYGAGNHRHMPEMENIVSDVTGTIADILFQPHLCPMDRGMLCSTYADIASSITTQQLVDTLQEAYETEPFVRVRRNILPATKYVTGTNYCDVTAVACKSRVIIFSAIDNLLKGASTQAIQNMNIMYGLEETTGLY